MVAVSLKKKKNFFFFFFFFSFFFFFFIFFFFQAEDGIRDLVRSRGLGDVYKRQLFRRGREKKDMAKLFQALRIEVNQEMAALREMLTAVSYTHLTLPTILLV